MIHTKGFKKEYLSQIIEMSHRNGFPENYDYVRKWTGMLSYDWNQETDFDFEHGMVIFDDDIIVGYFGGYYSLQNYNGHDYKYCNMTRWMLDEKYRKYFIKLTNEYLKSADVFSDYSASDAVLNVLTKLFHFKYIDKDNLRFFPVPYIGEQSVNVKKQRPEELPRNLNKALSDHLKYEIECVRFATKEEEGFVFFSVNRKSEEHTSYIRVYKVVNTGLFAKHAYELIWKLQKLSFNNMNDPKSVGDELFYRIKNNKLFMLECDSRCFGGNNIKHPLYTSKPERHLMLDKTEWNIPAPHLLYSENVVGYGSREKAEKEAVFESIV